MSMSPRRAAIRMMEALGIPAHEAGRQDPEGKTQDHLVFMLQALAAEDIGGEKAQRWLGYAQALAIMLGLTSLDAMKNLNMRSRHGVGNEG